MYSIKNAATEGKSVAAIFDLFIDYNAKIHCATIIVRGMVNTARMDEVPTVREE